MRQLALFLAAMLPMAGALLWADQTDPALDSLFAQLQRPDAGESAEALTKEIWDRWQEAGDANVNHRLQVGVIAMNAGYFQVAENAFDDVIRKAPEFAEGWNKRATVRFSWEIIRALSLTAPKFWHWSPGISVPCLVWA